MRKVYALAVFGLLLLLSFSESYGQTTIDAEFRPRSEYRSGFNQPLLDPLKSALVTMQRTRLNCIYQGGGDSAREGLQE